MRVTRTFLFLLLLSLMSVNAADYYVSPTGHDTSDGSQATPFQTISHAASIMTDGDVCHIMEGIYRETVDLSNKSDLTFKAFNGEKVVVSGLDEVSGWVEESPNVWYATVNNLLTRDITINASIASRAVTSKTYESQVFKDGEGQFLARWPNKASTASEDLMEKDWYDMTNAECQASDPEAFKLDALPDTAWTVDSLDGAYFWGLVQNTWASWLVPVESYDSANKTVNLSTYFSDENTIHTWIRTKHNPNIKDRNTYYGHVIILGAKVLLDNENEFFTDFDNNRLYVYSANPLAHNYEVKTRHNAFLLPATASKITIDGIDIVAATVDVDGATDCVIQDAVIDFPSYGYAPYLNNMTTAIPGLRALSLKGNGNIIRDSKIENCFGGAIEVLGNDNYVHNCVANNVNTMASWHSGFVVSGERNTVSHSTVSKVGRSGFSMNDANGCRIIYNDVSDVGYLTDDLGGLHSSRDVQNSEIAYNWFHDIQSGHAIYMDNYNSHYIVHHNVIWNTYGHGVNHNRPSSYSFIINNTVFENWAGDTKSDWTGLIGQRFGPWSDKGTRNHVDYDGQQADSSYGSMWFNNIARYGVISKTNRPYFGFQKLNNAQITSNTLGNEAFDPAIHQVGLAADSGIYIEGITEGVTDGKPDMGAYEITENSGVPQWFAGSDFVNPPALPVYQESKLVFRNLVKNGTFYRSAEGQLPEGWTTSSNLGDSALAINYNGYNDPPANQRNSVYTRSLTVVSASAELTYAETKVENLEPKKFYNFSAYIRLFPHGDLVSGVDDVALYVKDSNDVVLGTTTVKTFPNYSQDNRSTQQEWFMTEVSFELPAGETEVTLGFSTDDVGTFFIENVGLCRKFSQAPKILESTIPELVMINEATTFSIDTVSDAEGDDVTGYRWTIDGQVYEGQQVQHSFTALANDVELSVVAIDEWGVESMPLTKTITVSDSLPASVSAASVTLDSADLAANPIIIQPTMNVSVKNIGAGYDTVSLYIGESNTVDTSSTDLTTTGISDFSNDVKVFIPSDRLVDAKTYYYLIEVSGSGQPSLWSEVTSLSLDRLNMIPFADKALTHLASSDRRLTPGAELTTWQSLVNNGTSYPAVAELNPARVGGDLTYSVKGMSSVKFDESAVKINTPTTTAVTAFLVARRQATELGGDFNQRVISVLGDSNDFTASAGGWSVIKRVSSSDGSSVAFDTEVLKKSGATLRQGPVFLGSSANEALNADYKGEVFELVIYDRVLSAAEATVVQTWLNDKWTGSSFPQETLDWDGDGVTNYTEAQNGTDPSVANSYYELTGFAATQSGTALWWSVIAEDGVKEYRVVQDGVVVDIISAAKPNGGLYVANTLATNSEVEIVAVAANGYMESYSAYQQEEGALPPDESDLDIDENLPFVLIVGDSISIGYTDQVRAALDGTANVIHNPGNAGSSIIGFNNIDTWLYRQFDVIYFNFGLHDLKRLDGVNVQTEIPDYKSNLETIVDKMKANGGQVIFATTTPYPDVDNPVRYAADAVTYNTAATEVMNSKDVQIDDLYTYMSDQLQANPSLQIDANVHFTSDGYQALANQASATIATALAKASDLDEDGVSNELEIQLGTDPDNASSKPSEEYQDLYLWWKLDETTGTTAVDSSGFNRNATLSGNTTWTTGVKGGGLHFDGVNAFATHAMAQETFDAFTVSFWVKADSTSGNTTSESAFNNNSSGNDFQFEINGANYAYRAASDVTVDTLTTAWKHVAITYDGTDTKVYVDNSLKQTITGNLGNDFGQIEIGRNRGAKKYFAGIVDDLRVYKRTFDSAGVSEIYTNSSQNVAPFARNDQATTSEDIAVSVSVLTNDADLEGASLSLSAVTTALNGTTAISGNNVLYTPKANYNGADSFTYTVSDGDKINTATVNVTVQAVNDAPTAVADSTTANTAELVSINVLDNDSDIEDDSLSISKVTQGSNGSVAISGSSVTYTSAANYTGQDSFTYTVTDGDKSTVATVTVTVEQAQDPVAYWKLDEVAGPVVADEQGAFDGVLNGLAITGMAGIADNAFLFDGSTGFVNLGKPLKLKEQALSLVTWVNTTHSGSNQIVYEQGGVSRGIELAINADGKVVATYCKGRSTKVDVISDTTVNDGLWHMLSMVIELPATAEDSAKLKLYLNGQKIKEADISLMTKEPGSGAQIGSFGDGASGAEGWMNGLVDDLRLYQGSLSDAQILKLYTDLVNP